LAALKTGYFSSQEGMYEGMDIEVYTVYPDVDLSAAYRQQFKRYREFQQHLKQYYEGLVS